ncbi:hypothetical protein M8494_02370 [Serratia ureilytica]
MARLERRKMNTTRITNPMAIASDRLHLGQRREWSANDPARRLSLIEAGIFSCRRAAWRECDRRFR